MPRNGLGGVSCAERRPHSYTLVKVETLEAEEGPDFAQAWTLDRTTLRKLQQFSILNYSKVFEECSDKKKTEFSSSIRNFRWERLQIHI
jgi:hypothetical protein